MRRPRRWDGSCARSARRTAAPPCARGWENRTNASTSSRSSSSPPAPSTRCRSSFSSTATRWRRRRPSSGDGPVTKAEVRAVALGKLAIPTAGVVWDVGAGSGSVAIEIAALASHARVIAVERHDEDVRRIEANVAEHDVAIEVVHGEAPGALEPLPDPDRVFVGGGGLAVLDAVLAR